MTGRETPGDHGTAGRSAWPSERVRWLIEKCALPVTILLVPIVFQWMANQQAGRDNEAAAQRAKLERQAADDRARQEQRIQLYTSLLNKREETDTAVRRDIFQNLMGTYLKGGERNPQEKLVQLELLALNFHDTLNLSPLFWELQRQFETAQPEANRRELLDQLDRVAREVKDREAAVLELDGIRRTWTVPLTCVEEFDAEASGWRVPPDCKTDGAAEAQPQPQYKLFHLPRVGETPGQVAPGFRDFNLMVQQRDTENRRLLVTLSWPDQEMREQRSIRFWVDIFDFPLVNFSRVSANERIAVVLNSFDQDTNGAYLVLLYFPSNRSAAKDKPYIEDLTRRLLTQPPEPSAPADPGPAAIASPQG